MPVKTPAAATVTHPSLGTLIDNESLVLVEILGVGGYGVVYRAEDSCSTSPKSYAVKCLAHTSQNHISRQRQVRIREIALHQLASAHPNVISLHRVVEEHSRTFIIMDYAPDHDLFTQILNGCRYLGDDQLIKHVFLQILDAVEYCHSLGIYHRDLKPENILCFDGGLRIAITDFGLATTDKVSDEFRTGSIYHMSPECHGGDFAPTGSYSPMSNDIWSLGIILLNLATGRNPWKSASLSDPTFLAYCQDPANFIPSVLPISSEINDVLTRMLELDWRDRITLPELREAIEEIQTFYSEGVIFEGSMARCPWEAGMDIDGDDSFREDPPVMVEKSQRGELKSCWSDDSGSEMVFSTPSYAAQTSSCTASWTAYSSNNANQAFESLNDLFTRPRTPSSPDSPLSPCGSADGSFPVTPVNFDIAFVDQQANARRHKILTIDTTLQCPGYYHDPAESMSSYMTASSMMRTAVEYGSSSFYLASIPSDIGAGHDKEMTSPSMWKYSSSDVSLPSRYSSTRSSIVTCSLSFEYDRQPTPAPCETIGPTSPEAEVYDGTHVDPLAVAFAPPTRPLTPSKKILDGLKFSPARFFQRSSSPPATAPATHESAALSTSYLSESFHFASPPIPAPGRHHRRAYLRNPRHWFLHGKIFNSMGSSCS